MKGTKQDIHLKSKKLMIKYQGFIKTHASYNCFKLSLRICTCLMEEIRNNNNNNNKESLSEILKLRTNFAE